MTRPTAVKSADPGGPAIFYQPERRPNGAWLLRWEWPDGRREHGHHEGTLGDCLATYRRLNQGHRLGTLPTWQPAIKRRPRSPLSPRLRFRVLQRFRFRCGYCGISGVPLHVDHIVPRTNGGTEDEANLIAACEPCNLGKSGQPLVDIMPSVEMLEATIRRAADLEDELARYRGLFRRALFALALHRLKHGICSSDEPCVGCQFLADAEVAPLWLVALKAPAVAP